MRPGAGHCAEEGNFLINDHDLCVRITEDKDISVRRKTVFLKPSWHCLS